MRSLFAAVGAIALLLALGTCAVSKGAVHEIEALIWVLVGVVSLIGYAILGALERRPPSPPEK